MIDHQDTLDGPHYEAGLVLNGRLTRLHKGGGYSGPSKKEKAAQRKQDQMFMKMMAQGSKGVEMPHMPVIPPAPKPEPVPPPPSQSSADVEDAKSEARRSSAKRYGLLRTTHAGATGGYAGGTPMGGGRSLLG
jgi:type IV secretory pathway VirB10-like protein